VAAPATGSGGQDHGDLAARQFPLVPRPRTACRPLAERIDRVARLAGQAGRGASDALLHAAEACNLAALIASDCAMPGLARDLCWRQFDVFAAAGPCSETRAKLALQPLVNLARLHIRDGDGDAGYQLLESLYDGTRASRPQADIGGRAVNLASLIAPGDPRKAIVQWLWTVLLSDGLRALCRAGHWTAALHQAQRHNGIGQRLLDGRQIAVLAASASGQHDEAEQILQQTTAAESWEHAVAACLRAINLTSDNLASAPGTAAQMTRAYLAIDDPGHAMFAARLGLTVAELSDGHGSQQAVIDKVKRIAIQAADAYIAREVLTSPAAAFITRETRTTLRGTVHRAGLGNPLTTPQQQQLMNSISSAATTLAAALIPVRT
jgi:hypothetical protein